MSLSTERAAALLSFKYPSHIMIGPKLKRTFSSLKHHHSIGLDFFFLDVFSPEDASFVKLKAALESEVTTKLLVAVRFTAEKKSAASHLRYAMKTESVEIVTDLKVFGHTEKLQLITCCDNWENVEARALHRRGVLVL